MGGMAVVVPMARFCDGGEEGRRERVCVSGDGRLGWMYCWRSLGYLLFIVDVGEEEVRRRLITMCGFDGRVDMLLMD